MILDYGCGCGNYSLAAAHAFGPKCKVYAVDTNRQCLDYVNSRAKDEKVVCAVGAVIGTIAMNSMKHRATGIA